MQNVVTVLSCFNWEGWIFIRRLGFHTVSCASCAKYVEYACIIIIIIIIIISFIDIIITIIIIISSKFTNKYCLQVLSTVMTKVTA